MHLRAAREAQEALDGLGGGGPAAPDVGGSLLPSLAPPTAVAAVDPSATAPAIAATVTMPSLPTAAVTSSGAEAAAAAGAAGAGGASSSGNSSSVNVTDHFLDEESEDNGFSEMQTVALACIATLIPLFIILVAAFAIRFLWRKFRPRPGEGVDGEGGGGGGAIGYDGVLQRGESGEGAKADAVGGGASGGNGGHLLLLMPDELKTSESQFSVTPGDLDDVTSQSPLIGGSGKGHSNHKGVGTSKSANGSVITMTLQNNHLIVETEELASLPMVDESEPSPPHAVASSVEDTAQIHPPPLCADFRRAAPEDDLLDDDEELVGDLEGIAEEDEDEVAAAEREEEAAARGRKEPTGAASLAAHDSDDDFDGAEGPSGAAAAGGGAKAEDDGGQAGLSQSDLSETSSIGSSNPTYRYGNQLGYASGHFGYPQYAGYEPPKTPKSPGDGPRSGACDDGGGHWLGGDDPVNGEPAGEGDEEDEEAEKRHQRMQEQLGGGSGGGSNPGEGGKTVGGGHHRTGSLPKPMAADDSTVGGMGSGGGFSEADRIKCSKRRSLPIITTTPSAALGGFKKLRNEDEEDEGDENKEAGGGSKKKKPPQDVLKELPDGELLEVAEEEAQGSRGGSDSAALSAGGVGTNSGEHENEAFVETD